MSDTGFIVMARIVPAVGIALLVVVGTTAVRSYRRDKDRRLGLFAYATQRGWDYHGIDPFGLEQRWQCRPFGVGDDRHAAQVVTGTVGARAFVAFDYSYTESSPGSDGSEETVTQRFRVASVAMPTALPALEVAQEGLAGRVRSAVSPDDIELESEAFNRRFRVSCADPKLASDVLPPRTMDALLRSGFTGSLRVCGSDLIAVDRGQHTVDTLCRQVEALAAFVDGVPSFVWAGRR